MDHYLATIQTILDRCDDNNTSPSIDDMEIIKINLYRIIQTRYGITQLWFIPLIERISAIIRKQIPVILFFGKLFLGALKKKERERKMRKTIE